MEKAVLWTDGYKVYGVSLADRHFLPFGIKKTHRAEVVSCDDHIHAVRYYHAIVRAIEKTIKKE